MKKFLSILLVFAMVLSLSTPAFAVDAPTNIGSTEEGKNIASHGVTASYTPPHHGRSKMGRIRGRSYHR